MSGHSKWNNIAKRKGANDAKKAKIFTKIGREMAIAIKEGGSANPDFNARLRDCIAKAKANNMPNDNIKRTLDKYSGANGQVDYEANNYEGYGVGGVAVVVETLTDNKNRTVADVRHLFDKYGAGLGASGCVSWQFDKKGVIIMESEGLDEDAVMMQALDAGAEDFLVEEGVFEIYTAPDDFSTVREALEKEGYTFAQAELQMVPQNYITLEKEEDMAQMRKLLDNLEDNDDVQAVWHNWENEDDYEGKCPGQNRIKKHRIPKYAVLSSLSHKLHRTHCSLGAIRYGLCHLQQTAGAVTGRKQAGHSRRAVGVRLDARAVQLRAQLAGEIAAASRTIGDKHAGNAQRFSLGKRHARHQFIALNRAYLARFHAQTVRQIRRGLAAIGQQRNGLRHRQQHPCFLERILTLTEHGNVLAAIEKRVTDGAVADAAALKCGYALDFRHRTRRTGCQNDRIRVKHAVRSLNREALRRILNTGYLGLPQNRTQTFSLLLSALEQLCPGNRLNKAEIILDLVRFDQRTAVLIQNGCLHAGAYRVNRSTQSRRSATNDNHIGHSFVLSKLRMENGK